MSSRNFSSLLNPSYLNASSGGSSAASAAARAAAAAAAVSAAIANGIPLSSTEIGKKREAEGKELRDFSFFHAIICFSRVVLMNE